MFQAGSPGPVSRRRNFAIMASRLKRILVIIAVSAVLLFVGFRYLRGLGDSEEDRVRAVIDAIEEAVEDKDIGGVMTHLAEDYKDGDGLQKQQIRLMLMRDVL